MATNEKVGVEKYEGIHIRVQFYDFLIVPQSYKNLALYILSTENVILINV